MSEIMRAEPSRGSSAPDGQSAAKGWLPIVLCPTDGVDRALLLPDGSEVVGAHHGGGLGRPSGWETKKPIEIDRPVYEERLRGGFLGMPWEQRASQPEPEPKQIGTRKEIMWLVGRLPEGVYPTHFRPNDTVYGNAYRAAEAALCLDTAGSTRDGSTPQGPRP